MDGEGGTKELLKVLHTAVTTAFEDEDPTSFCGGPHLPPLPSSSSVASRANAVAAGASAFACNKKEGLRTISQMATASGGGCQNTEAERERVAIFLSAARLVLSPRITGSR